MKIQNETSKKKPSEAFLRRCWRMLNLLHLWQCRRHAKIFHQNSSEVLGDVTEAILRKEEDVSRDQNVNSTVQCRTVTSGDGDTDVLLKLMSSVECPNTNDQETKYHHRQYISPIIPIHPIPLYPLTTHRPSAPPEHFPSFCVPNILFDHCMCKSISSSCVPVDHHPPVFGPVCKSVKHCV